jgi:hypothetical protein
MYMERFLHQSTKQADAIYAADAENQRRAQHIRNQDQPRFVHPYLAGTKGHINTSSVKLARPDVYTGGYWRAEEPAGGARGAQVGTGTNAHAQGCANAAERQQKGASTSAGEVQHMARTWVQEKSAKDKNGGPDYALRLYSAASLQTMWQHISKLPDRQRHIYELIREGYPCHLYFDLEFNKELNPGMDGAAAVLLLLQITRTLTKCAAS